MRLLVALVLTTLFATYAQNLSAQGPLRDLFEEVDRHRPRGRILKQLFGNENDLQNQNQNANSDPRQPTPATPQGQTEKSHSGNGNRQPAGNANNQTPNNNRFAQPQNPSQTPTNRLPNTAVVTGNSKVELGAKLSIPRNGTGLIIADVAKGSPAENAGLQPGDIITTFGGIKVTKEEEVNDVLGILSRGDQIEVEFVRRGKSDKSYVQFGEPNVDSLTGTNETAPNSLPNSRSIASTGNSSDGNSQWENNNTNQQTTSRRSSLGDYDPIQPPGNDSAYHSDSPVSVLSNLHSDSAPALRQPAIRNQNTNEQDLSRQILELRSVIEQQEKIIERMHNQLNDLQNRSSNRPQPTLAPPIR